MVQFNDPKAVPHKFRNRFLKESGAAVRIKSGSSSASSGSGSSSSSTDVNIEGTGNAIVSAELSGNTLTLTYGTVLTDVSWHTNNTDIHITAAERSAWNTHANNTTKHITAAERSAWNAKWDYDAATIAGVKVNNAKNADNATKLTAARSLWGQSFDGSADVTGGLASVEDITFTVKRDVTTMIHNDANACWIGMTKDSVTHQPIIIWDRAEAGVADSVQIYGMYSQRAGNVGIGVASPTAKLHVAGDVLATGGVTAYTTSDRRLKDNIEDIDCLDVIKSLGGVKQFDYREGGNHSIGLIAQNLEHTELWDAVYEREDGYKAVNYLDSRMVSLALGACDQLRKENEALRLRLMKLEKLLGV